MIVSRYRKAIVLLFIVAGFALGNSESLRKKPKLIDVFANFVDVVGDSRNVGRHPKNITACTRDIARLRDGVEAGELWALKMLDASSKVPSGILNGNIHDLGRYDQCLDVKTRDNAVNIRGRHCVVSVTVSNECEPVEDTSKLIWMQTMVFFTPPTGKVLRMTSSVCLPSTCDVVDITEMTNAAIAESPHLSASGMDIIKVTCSPLEVQHVKWPETLLLLSLGLWIIVLLICTIYDNRRVNDVEKNGVRDVSAKFSLLTNAKALLSLDHESGAMPALDGLRCVNVCVAVATHRYLAMMGWPQLNLLEVANFQLHWFARVLMKLAFDVIESFLVLSGFLRTYNFLMRRKNAKKYSVFADFRHRYIRFTPGITMVSLLSLFLINSPLVRSGPMWDSWMSYFVTNREKNVWLNHLYIHNILDPVHMFLLHTWTSAVDMQLYWISIFILYPLYRWPRKGLVILSLFVAASMLVPAVIIMLNNSAAIFDSTNSNLTEAGHLFQVLYTATYNRASSYFVGMYLGYLIAAGKWNLTKTQLVINWILCCIGAVFSLGLGYFVQPFAAEGYSLIAELLFASCARPIWGAVVGWIIFICTQGYGGPITTFLSMPIFLPLSRLSFSIYLVHPLLQFTSVASVREAERVSFYTFGVYFLGDMALSIFFSILIELLVNYPVRGLESIILSRGCENKKAEKIISKKKRK